MNKKNILPMETYSGAFFAFKIPFYRATSETLCFRCTLDAYFIHYSETELYHCSDPHFSTLVGREELDTQMAVVVQSILADRYIHCRGLWVASLEARHPRI